MMGLLDVKETELAKNLWQKLMYPVTLSEAEDNKWTFVNLMNKAYPHALFTPRIFDAYWRRGNNVRTYAFLEEVPEFIDWWRIAHVRPSAEDASSVSELLEPQGRIGSLDGIRKWLHVQLMESPETTPEADDHIKPLDPPNVPAHDDDIEEVTSENAHSDIDWDELDAMEALL